MFRGTQAKARTLAGGRAPQLHCVRSVIHGLADFYCFHHSTIAKDANLQLSVLPHLIDWAALEGPCGSLGQRSRR
eukprot:15050139-Alexandrium_andersonii.AAC.1